MFDRQTFQFLNASRGALENTGYTQAEIQTMCVYDLNPDLNTRWVADKMVPLFEKKESMITLGTTLRRKDGTIYEADAVVQLTDSPDPDLIAYVVDISARNQAQQQAREAQDVLRTAIETLPDAFVLYDKNDHLVVCNQKYKEFYPLSASVMEPGTPFIDILREGLKQGEYVEAVGREQDWLVERMRQHQEAQINMKQHLIDGRWLRIIESETPDGGRVGLRIDITEEIESRNRAEQAEQYLIDAINASPAGFLLFDKDDRLVLYNPQISTMFNKVDWEPAIGLSFEDVLRESIRAHPMNLAGKKEQEWLESVLSNRNDSTHIYEGQMKDGTWIRFLDQRSTDGGYVSFRFDITAFKHQEAELRLAAQTDPLTGLLNRRGLSDVLDALTKADPTAEFALLHIDLDKFKAINDVMGHAAGDHVLIQSGIKLRTQTRRDDVVARVGGDEFVICCKITELTDVDAMARRVVETQSEPIIFEDKPCYVGASIGVATWRPRTGQLADQALQDADIALKISKDSGRGKYVTFLPEMRHLAQASAQLAHEIVQALADDAFCVWFQPQLSLDGEKVIGFESLVRWQHPERGLLLPGDFLPAADEANLMDSLDQHVLYLTCAAMSELMAAGFENPRFSINLSTSRLCDPNLLDTIHTNLSLFDLRPDQLVMEILESTLLDERTANVVENIGKLAASGFSVELDDFGTGHTAIASLREFPVDRIKIDRSLIRGIDQDAELRMITSAIINLCSGLGLNAICEGVETAAELSVLKELGCREVQGYYFAKPMPISDLVSWLWDRNQPLAADIAKN
ncbi:EAL domain-containing protein [Aestuariibius sp. HNIBRBA575]|uniref:sensor domain-containing protein n=1 Tax=Aestuariibius sp. HNIBRBA575 TaxID=3233343 RepID=UPI0034A27914